MNKNIEEQLNKMKQVFLEDAEKDAVRGALLSFMQKNPLKEGLAEKAEQNNPSLFGWWTLSYVKPQHSLIAAVFVVVLIGSGTSFAAEGSLPGDILYPIKININENIQQVAAFSDNTRAQVQADLATRRLVEAEKLAVIGKLTPETSASLQSNFQKHTALSKASIAKMDAKGDVGSATNASSNLQVALETHAQILGAIQEQDPTSSNLQAILVPVTSSIQDVASTRSLMEIKVTAGEPVQAKKYAKSKMVVVQKQINTAKNLFAQQKNTLSPEIQETILGYFDSLDNIFSNGVEKLNSQSYTEAYISFGEAERYVRSAIILIDTTHVDTTHEWKANPPIVDIPASGGGISEPGSGGAYVCPAMAKQCPNGTYVTPTGPKCEYICSSSSGQIPAPSPVPQPAENITTGSIPTANSLPIKNN